MLKQQKYFQAICDAREVLSQGVETMQTLHDQDDKLTALKTAYQIAIAYQPDTLERKRKLYLISIDKYMDILNQQRTLNLYQMQRHRTPIREKRDKILHSRQEALITFQKYALIHGRVYQDDTVVLDKQHRIVKITADQFYSYVKPYQTFLQKEFIRLRPTINKKKNQSSKYN